MVYNYEDESEISDLSQFTDELIEEVLCSALFQHKSEKESLQNQKQKFRFLASSAFHIYIIQPLWTGIGHMPVLGFNI